MSEDRQSIVDLTAGEQDAARLASDLSGWLLHEQIIQANPDPDALVRPSRYLPGERWRSAVEESSRSPDLLRQVNNGVDIHTARAVFGPGEYGAPQACPACGYRSKITSQREFDQEVDTESELLRAWQEHGEPLRSCGRCGQARPVGDWVDLSFAVASFGISFNNWPPLSERFVESVKARLGPRTGLIYEHL